MVVYYSLKEEREREGGGREGEGGGGEELAEGEEMAKPTNSLGKHSRLWWS